MILANLLLFLPLFAEPSTFALHMLRFSPHRVFSRAHSGRDLSVSVDLRREIAEEDESD